MADIFDILRVRWEDYLTGGSLDAEHPYTKKAAASLDDMADAGVGYKAEPASGSVVYNTPYFTLRTLALAYRMPGSRHYRKTDTRDYILAELERLHKTDYNMDTPPDNWWAVEVGIPLRLLDILVLLYEELPDRENLIRRHTDIILHFKDAYHLQTKGQMVETGANLVWKCSILMLTGVLRREQHWLDWGNEQLATVLQYSQPKQMPGAGLLYDDGFYLDGSFIQHYFFAYTGGYGRHLISVLSGVLYAWHGTGALTLPQDALEFLYKMVFDAYEPLVYNSRFMDIARGRETSRYFQQDYITGRQVMRALCYLCATMPQPWQARCQAMIKEWLSHSGGAEALLTDEDCHAEYSVYGSLVPVLQEIEASDTAPRGELITHKTFGAMAKVVHLGKGYGAAISMYSPTIACYEYLNGESQKFWHMSDGMTYLYTAADPDGYNHDYYGTVDMQRLPGTTVDRSPARAQDAYYSWMMPEAKNVYAFAGGSDMDGLYGIAGLQYRGQGTGKQRDLEVKKSWFMFDDEIVCLGSGITSTTGHPIETIVENKRLLPGAGNHISINGGEAVPCHQLAADEAVSACENVSTLHITGNTGTGSDTGYWFPEGATVNILCEHREGTWNQVAVDPDNKKQNNFATLWLPHGEKPVDASYAYVLLPCKTADETRRYARKPDVRIIENSTAAHAVAESALGLLGINFWQAGECAGVRCSNQASVMVRDTTDELVIAISDPTNTGQSIELAFDFSVSAIVAKAEGIKVLDTAPLRLLADTTGQHGQSLRLDAKK